MLEISAIFFFKSFWSTCLYFCSSILNFMLLAFSLLWVYIVNNLILFLRRKAWIWAGVHQGKSRITGLLYIQVSWVWYKSVQIDASDVNIKEVCAQKNTDGIHISMFPSCCEKKNLLINYSRVVRKIIWLFTLILKGMSVHWWEFSIAQSLNASFIFFEYYRQYIFSFYIYFKNSAQSQGKGLEYVRNHTSLTGDPKAKSNWIAFSFSLCNIKYSYLQQWKICQMDWSNMNYICHII